jgi:glycosyltransferase involved in cell wall biosynthesis
MTLVSVVMAVYNDARSVRAAVHSVLEQTFEDFEFVVVDDGSTDGTGAILDELARADGRIKLLRNAQNLGQTLTLNRGIEAASGRYIARMDADDLSLAERLARQVAFLEAHAEVGLLGTRALIVNRRGRPLHVLDYPTDDESIRARMMARSSFCHGAAMMRRAALEAVGLYRPAFRLAQDMDLWLRIAGRFRVANLPDVLYHLRLTPASANVRRNSEQTAYVELARRLAGERDETGEEQTNLEREAQAIVRQFDARGWSARRRGLARDYANWAAKLARWGHAWPDGVEMWLRALLAWPFEPATWLAAARGALRRPYHALRGTAAQSE